jgi:transcriptional regulator with XRE-family HTH domain
MLNEDVDGRDHGRGELALSAVSMTARAGTVGTLLRDWRQRRKLSQLEVSLQAAVSARHLSFVETGRSQPSRELVLHLCEQLDVPLRERNVLLLAAGYAPIYQQHSLDAAELAPARAALERFLRAHEPYPALVLDGHYSIVSANDALNLLTDGIAPDLLMPPANALRLSLHPEGMASRIVNFDEWSGHLLHRLRRRAALTGDVELEKLHEELATYPGVKLDPPLAATDILVPLRLRIADTELSFLSTVSTFGTALDITLEELSIEAFYPADAATANYLLSLIARP